MQEELRLLADGGSTSVKWAVLQNGAKPRLLRSAPLNPLFTPPEEQLQVLRETFPETRIREHVHEVRFYGASCGPQQSCESLRESLTACFPHATITLDSDMQAAWLACWAGAPGLTAILGTGSNLGYHNGQSMTYFVPSLGYLLGDEGSGAWIGQRALRDWLYGRIPPGLAAALAAHAHEALGIPHRLSTGERAQRIVDLIYRAARPNTLLAGFARPVIQQAESAYSHELLSEAMNGFAKFFCKPAAAQGHTKLRAVGSVAHFCQNLLATACERIGIQLESVVRSPIEGILTEGAS